MDRLHAARCDLHDIFTVGIHDEDLPASGPCGGESDLLSIRTHRGIGIVGRAGGELNDGGAVNALAEKIRVVVVARTGEDHPFSSWIDRNIGIETLLDMCMLLKVGVACQANLARLHAAHFTEDIHITRIGPIIWTLTAKNDSLGFWSGLMHIPG